MFVDSDDLFHRRILEILYNSAVKGNADISICNYERVCLLTYKTSMGISDTSHVPATTFKALDMSQSIFNTFDGFVWNKIFNRKFLIKNSLLFDGRLTAKTHITVPCLKLFQKYFNNSITMST